MNRKVSKMFMITFICIQMFFCINYFLRYDDDLELAGVSETNEFPQLNFENVWNGNWGYKYNMWFADNFPYRSTVVELYNVYKYSALNEITNTWIMGKDGWMYNEADSERWALDELVCAEEEINDFAQKVAFVQNYLESQGKSYIYILTPVKASVYPEYLPLRYQFGNLQQSDRTELLRLKTAFDTYGVNYYDAYTDMLLLKDSMDVYYKTGHHWSVQACATIMNNVIQQINENPNIELPNIEIIGLEEKYYFDDRDILNIANLPKYDYSQAYVYPILDYVGGGENHNIFIFSTSYG